MNPYHPIGVFDSGVGGLTVANGIATHLPNEQIIYFGDIAHLPYGDKSENAIQHYCQKITQFLLEKNCKLIVIACNTASAAAYELLQEQFGHQALIVNVIEPVVQSVLDSQIQKIGVIGTRRTIKSGEYPKQLKASNPTLKVVCKATQSLASMIEEGLFRNPKLMDATVEHYLSDPDFQDIDGLILGCTHYPIIKADVQRYLGTNIPIFDSTINVALHIKELLSSQNLLNDQPAPAHQFFVSDYTRSFEQTASIFFKSKIQLNYYPLWEEKAPILQ